MKNYWEKQKSIKLLKNSRISFFSNIWLNHFCASSIFFNLIHSLKSISLGLYGTTSFQLYPSFFQGGGRPPTFKSPLSRVWAKNEKLLSQIYEFKRFELLYHSIHCVLWHSKEIWNVQNIKNSITWIIGYWISWTYSILPPTPLQPGAYFWTHLIHPPPTWSLILDIFNTPPLLPGP